VRWFSQEFSGKAASIRGECAKGFSRFGMLNKQPARVYAVRIMPYGQQVWKAASTLKADNQKRLATMKLRTVFF